MKKLIFSLFATSLWLGTGFSDAQIYEGFGDASQNGPSIDGYSGSKTSTGFSGEWKLTSGTKQRLHTSGKDQLDFIGINEGVSPESNGGRQHWWKHEDEQKISVAERPLRKPLNLSEDGTFFISFFSRSSAIDYNALVGLHNGSQELMLGHCFKHYTQRGLTAYFGPLGTDEATNANHAPASFAGNAAETGFFVAKLTKSDSGGTDRLTVDLHFYNLNLTHGLINASESPRVSRTIELKNVRGQFSHLQLKLSGSKRNQAGLDEIRVGRSWKDVTGTTQEMLPTASRPTPINRNVVDAELTTALSWTAPVDNSIKAVQGYRIYMGTNPDISANTKLTSSSETVAVELEPGKTYYWRVDSAVKKADGSSGIVIGDLWTFRTTPTPTHQNLNPDPSWYVSDTTAGEWIEFTDVHFSEGTYRFTGHLGAETAGKTVTITLDGKPLGKVTVPATGCFERFELVHLGRTTLQAGHYDVRLTFDTGEVSADMIYVRKSSETSSQVVDDDIANPQPSLMDGSSVTPLTTRSSFRLPWGSPDFNDESRLSWYRQPMYKNMLHDEFVYATLDEQIAARSDFMWVHGKLTTKKEDWGYDRDYVPENGNGGSNKSKRFYEILDTHPFGDYLKFGYFIDNAIYGNSYKNATGKEPDWGSPHFQEWIWTYWTKPWFEAIPPHRIFLQNNHCYLNYWTANCGVGNPEGIASFMIDTKRRIKGEYGYDTHLVLNGSFSKRPDVRETAYAAQPWFLWSQPQTWNHLTMNEVTLSVMTNGRRLPLMAVWKPDWNPVNNSGTRINDPRFGDDGDYRATHTDGVSDYRMALKEADAIGSEWMLLEAWVNMYEGTVWYRSDHEDNLYPNEFINISREFADKATDAILLQAEGCDKFSDSTPGNSGRSYRYHWHADNNRGAPPDLDIFRPRRKLLGFRQFDTPKKELISLTGGKQDIWGIDSQGQPWATEMDGNAWWEKAKSNNLTFDQIELGNNAWALVGNDVYRAGLPRGWRFSNCNNWQKKGQDLNYIDISANLIPNQVWAVDRSGRIWIADQDTAEFKKVSGPQLNEIAAGETFVWGITADRTLVRHEAELTGKWKSFPNPLKLEKLAAGSNEIWGRTAGGKLYRTSEHGEGTWEFVSDKVQAFGVAREFVWIIKEDNTAHWSKLVGFAESGLLEEKKTPSIPVNLRAAGLPFSVALDWADAPEDNVRSYNLYRSTSSGHNGKLLAFSIGASDYRDEDVESGTTYYYTVSAVNTSGKESRQSKTVSAGPTVLSVDSEERSITYRGKWKTRKNEKNEQNKERHSSARGASATISFSGTKIWYYGSRGKNMGKVRLLLDGKTLTEIDCYSEKEESSVLLYESPELRPGRHKFTVGVLGTKNPNSQDAEIVVDAFGYVKTPARR